MKRSSRVILHVVSWVVALAIMAVLMSIVDVRELGARLANVEPVKAVAAALLVVAMLVIKGARWWLIAREHGHATAGMCIRLTWTGIFLNTFVPLRGGDVARGLMLSRMTGMDRSRALGTVALDKLFDMLAISVAVVPLLALGGIPPWIRWPAVGTIAGAALALVAALVIRSRMRGREPPAGRWGRVLGAVASFASGFDTALRPGALVVCSALSVAQYVILLGSFALGLSAAGIEPNAARTISTLLASQFAAGLPVTPSGAGAMHGAIMAVLSATGVAREPAMGAAVLLHAVLMGPVLLVGAVVARGTVVDLGSRPGDGDSGGPTGGENN